jgi:hypothetical protein
MIIYLIGCVIIIILLIFLEFKNKKQQTFRRQQTADVLNVRIQHVDKSNTIFVVLPMLNPANAGKTLTRIFESAYCPQRVFVGILEHGTKYPTAINQYVNELHGSSSPSFVRNVKHIQGDKNTEFGGSIARQEIMNTMYAGEKFIFCAHEHSWFLDNWDKILISSLETAHKLGGHAISQFPLETSSTDDTVLFKHALATTFPVCQQFHGHCPSFKGQFVINSTPGPFRVTAASYKCFFSTAEVFLHQLQLHTPGIPYLTGSESDFLLSMEMWRQGYHTFCPSQSVLIHTSYKHERSYVVDFIPKIKKVKRAILEQIMFGQNSQDEPLAYVKKIQDRCHFSMSDFCEWIGVNLKEKHVSGQTTLGLFHGFQEKDILNRYGSLYTFKKYKNQFTYD